MKKIFYLVLLLITVAASASNYPSKVKSVIVFQTRAEVTRSASINLSPGEQELVFSGVSTVLDQNNIQVRGTGKLTILGISFRQNFLNENELPEELQEVQNQINELNIQIRQLTNKTNALASERKLLEGNQRIGGNQENLSLDQLKSISTYYRTRLNDIADEQLELEQKVAEKRKELNKLYGHLNDRTSAFQKNSGEIVVNVDVAESTKANLDIIYMVNAAGWRAEYDIRSEDVGEQLQLTYKAIITQKTGEDWKDVDLILSTGNPNAGIIKPDLNPQYLDFSFAVQNVLKGKAAGVQLSGYNDMRQAAPMADMDMEVLEETVVEDVAFTSDTKTMYTNYVVDRHYSLNSGDKPLNVRIREQKVDADYEYQTVPKLRPRVFLVAKAKNWGELVLLPGPINIFFEGGYVGKSFMDPNSTADNLPISLGYDPRLSIERKKLKDLSSKRTIGSNQKETIVYEISLKNNKSKEIQVKIQDQILVTRNGDIKVENVETNGGSIDPNTGEVSWIVSLQPGKQVKQQLKYEVRYPKGRSVTGL